MTKLLEFDSSLGINTIVDHVTLAEVSDPGTVADTGFIYAKDVSGATELFYYDDSGQSVQITDNGSVIVGSHAASHIQGGSDEVDGDQLDIDFTPSNYSPDTTPGEVSDVDHLSAHLAGIDNALPKAAGNGSYIFGTLSGDQSTGLTNGDPIQWDTDSSSAGNDITLDGVTNVGRFTLAAGKTYKLSAMLQAVFSGSSGTATFQWYNVTGAAYIGKQHTAVPMNSTNLSNIASPAVAYVTPSVSTDVELRLNGIPTSLSSIESDTSWATIEAVHGNGLFAGSYLYASMTVNSQSISNGGTIEYDEVLNSNGDSISLDTSTNVGRFTLSGGRNYRITTQIAATHTGDNTVVHWNLYSVTGAAVIGNCVGMTAKGNVGGPDDPRSNAPILSYVVSPTTDTEYEIRMNGTGADAVYGLPTWLMVEEIAQPMEEKSYTFAVLSGDQSSFLGANDPVQFDTDSYAQGNAIGAVSSNSWTLEADRSYVLKAHLSAVFSGATGVLEYQWYDTTNTTFIGKKAVLRAQTNTTDANSNEEAMAVFQPGSAVTVELRVVASTAITLVESDESWATIETIDGVAGGGINHATTHLLGGNDEIDADQLGIDFTPSNYTPSVTPAEVDDLDHLTAHLAGIDDALAAGSGDVNGPGSSTDNSIVRWDGTSGDTIQNSGVSIDDSNNLVLPGSMRLGEVSDPTNVADTGFVYVKDDGGDTELYFMDDGGAVVQLTNDGTLVDHASAHIQGGTDEIDGDQLDIDFTPTNYSPDTTPGEVSDVDHLSAHLAGIDNALAGVDNTITLTNDNASAATQGMVVYISGDGSFDLADADAASTARAFGIVADASIASAGSGEVAYTGTATVPSARQNGVWTAGDRIYVDTTAGDMTNSAPTAGGTYVAMIGICINTPGGGDATVAIVREPLIAN